MHLPVALRIALRYLVAKKSHRAVNVIASVSMAGVAVATAATIIVLSVFNGFTELSRSQLGLIDPDLAVFPVEGKTFTLSDSLTDAFAATEGVAAVMPTLTERALLVGGNAQMPVQVKGVPAEGYTLVASLDSLTIDGVFDPTVEIGDDAVPAFLAVGTAMSSGLRPSVVANGEIYVPRRRGRFNPANPAASYRSARIRTTGVFRTDQPAYDTDYIIIPLDALRNLLEYESNEAGSIEIALLPGGDPARVAREIENLLPGNLKVMTREQMSAETFRMIAVEKWITFLMLSFILVIACFNVVSTLSLMVLEKRNDMSTLLALGATPGGVRSVFVWEGALITLAGGIAGLIGGVLLAAAQQTFGFVKLGADPGALTIDVYPVAVSGVDIAVVLGALLAVALVVGQISRLFTRKIF